MVCSWLGVFGQLAWAFGGGALGRRKDFVHHCGSLGGGSVVAPFVEFFFFCVVIGWVCGCLPLMIDWR